MTTRQDTSGKQSGRRRSSGPHHPRRSAVGSLALLAALTVPTVASASEAAASNAAATSTATADDEIGARLERACLRIPNLTIRTTNLIERINGDAETRGSLLWLQSQIDRAEAQGREQLVTVLENRLEVRAATLPVLEVRLESLRKLSVRCNELGVGA